MSVAEREVLLSRQGKSPSKILINYLLGYSRGIEAFDKLLKKGDTSQIYHFAGSIALQESHKASKGDVEGWLLKAAYCLGRSAQDSATIEGQKSGLLKAQFAAYEHMARTHLLPDESLARAVYKSTVDYAAKLVCERGLCGIKSEAAVLLLGQRSSLRLGPESWYMLPSFISEDRFGAWDIDGYTHYDEFDPYLEYKLQVKNSNNADKSKENENPGVTFIVVNSDLAIHPSERFVEDHIIQGAYEELYDCGGSFNPDALAKREEIFWILSGSLATPL